MAFRQNLAAKVLEEAPILEDLQIGFREGVPMIKDFAKYAIIFALCTYGGDGPTPWQPRLKTRQTRESRPRDCCSSD
jgi:hypothetical protein